MLDLSAISQFTGRDEEQFKRVCNLLLGKTYILRNISQGSKGRIPNLDYQFLRGHKQIVGDYLAMLGWELHEDKYNGYFYVLNSNETNRISLDKTQTGILLSLRLIYEEKQNEIGMDNDVIATVREVLDIMVTEYALLSVKPNMDVVRRGFKLLENYCIIENISGVYSKPDGEFAILPTILTAVSAERLEAVCSMLRKEEHDETVEEGTIN